MSLIVKQIYKRHKSEILDLVEPKEYFEKNKEALTNMVDVSEFYEKNKEAILKMQDELRSKNWKANCNYIISFGGHDYFGYKSSDLIPIERHSLITDQLIMMAKKLTREEQEMLIDGLFESANKMMNSYNEKKKVEHIKEVHFCAMELKGRNDDLMFHPDIILEIIALSIIRDDENPAIFDEVIHKQKMDTFKKEGGEIPFYLQVGLGEYLPNWKESIEQSKELLEKHIAVIKYRNSIYENLIGKDKSTETDKFSKTG